MTRLAREAVGRLESSLPDEITPLIELLGKTAAERGERAYLVGGFVRDLLLGLENLDVDVVVEGDGIGLARSLASAVPAEMTEHRRFGTATVTVSDRGLRIDVSTARKETYPGPAELPVVSPGMIEDDLGRRDFTINCLAIAITREGLGELLDPCGGLRDLRRGLVRVLHRESFRDDPTRVLRAARFAARFDFTIESKTRGWLRGAVRSRLLERLTRERLRNEWLQIFEEPRPSRSLALLEECGALGALDPRPMRWPSRRRAMAWVENESRRLEKEVHLDRARALLLTYLGDLGRVEFDYLTKQLALSRELATAWRELEAVTKRWQAVRSEEGPLGSGLIYSSVGAVSREGLLALAAGEPRMGLRQALMDYLRALAGTPPCITGDDLKALGIPEGPVYSALLREVYAAQLDGIVETKRQAKHLAGKLVKQRGDRGRGVKGKLRAEPGEKAKPKIRPKAKPKRTPKAKAKGRPRAGTKTRRKAKPRAKVARTPKAGRTPRPTTRRKARPTTKPKRTAKARPKSGTKARRKPRPKSGTTTRRKAKPRTRKK